jgi:hypothetical protein
VLALFCVAWLQAAVVPCVMAHAAGGQVAAEAASPLHVEGMHGYHDHGAAASEESAASPSPCLYCPTSGADHQSCDGHAGCAYPHDPQVDARASAIFAAVPVAFVAPVARVEHYADLGEASAPDAIPRIRLSVSYCRFIE